MKKRINIKDIKGSRGKTNWDYLKRVDEPINNDPETPPLTQYELNQLKRPKNS